MFVSNLDGELKSNTTLHISSKATKESEIGKGLATRLSQLVCEHARQTRNFRYGSGKETEILHHTRNGL